MQRSCADWFPRARPAPSSIEWLQADDWLRFLSAHKSKRTESAQGGKDLRVVRLGQLARCHPKLQEAFNALMPARLAPVARPPT
eukprot:8683140-Pyramimonas_sp.AAC.1